jgi:hypothetical protein
MRKLYELDLEYPFAGSRRLRDRIGQFGLLAGRRTSAP